jgi:hypothetical protein
VRDLKQAEMDATHKAALDAIKKITTGTGTTAK